MIQIITDQSPNDLVWQKCLNVCTNLDLKLISTISTITLVKNNEVSALNNKKPCAVKSIWHSSSSFAPTTVIGFDGKAQDWFLDIWLNEKNTLEYHIDILVNKPRQKIGFLYRSSTSFPMISRK